MEDLKLLKSSQTIFFKLDRTELGCLKAIVLYNPDVKQLQDPSLVEELREKVYATLEAYGTDSMIFIILRIINFINFDHFHKSL